LACRKIKFYFEKYFASLHYISGRGGGAEGECLKYWTNLNAQAGLKGVVVVNEGDTRIFPKGKYPSPSPEKSLNQIPTLHDPPFFMGY
jgi:hypothetical protein